MFQFIATNVLMISLGVILYAVVRTLPRIEENPSTPDEKGAWEKWITSGIPEKIDSALNSFLEKSLRRLRILLMKLDNSVTVRLGKIRPAPTVGKPKVEIDFADIAKKNENADDEQAKDARI